MDKTSIDIIIETANGAILRVLDSMNHFSADYKRTETKDGFFDFALDAVYTLFPAVNSQTARRAAQVITHYYFF